MECLENSEEQTPRQEVDSEEAQLREVLGAMWDCMKTLPPHRQIVVALVEERTPLPSDARNAVYGAKESELLDLLVEQTGLVPDLCAALYDLAKGETQYQRMQSFLTTSSYIAMQQRGDMGLAH